MIWPSGQEHHRYLRSGQHLHLQTDPGISGQGGKGRRGGPLRRSAEILCSHKRIRLHQSPAHIPELSYPGKETRKVIIIDAVGAG